MITDVMLNKMSREELIQELKDSLENSDKLNDENAKLLTELITAKDEVRQLKIKLANHEDRIKQNEAILQ
jgi:hypothetical protein